MKKKLLVAALIVLSALGPAYLLCSNDSPDVASAKPVAKPYPRPVRVKTAPAEDADEHKWMTGTIGGFAFTSEITAEPIKPVSSLVPEHK